MKLVLTVETFSCDEGKYDRDYSEYVVPNFQIPGWDKDLLQKEVDRITSLAELDSNNDYEDGDFFNRNVVDWEVVDDDYVTPYDIQQENWELHNPSHPVRYWSPTIDQVTGKVFRKVRGWDFKIYINNELVKEAA